nr:hypothetical protein [Tanacetum cinerariifolium]
MSLGIGFPGDKSPGKRRWGSLVRDSFPGEKASRYHPIFDLTKNLWKTRIDKKLPPRLTVYMQNWSKASDIASGRDIRDNGYEPPDELDYNDICQAASMVESKLGAQRVLAFSHPGNSSERTSRGSM